MVGVYASLCEKGKKNFFDVPVNLQDKVRTKIESDGYTIDEDGSCHKNTEE